ncbi:MAG: hypothetical protein ACYTAN_08795 [Planctomycetota bacterium]
MARFKFKVAGVSAGVDAGLDGISPYEEMAKFVKRNGFDMMIASSLAGRTYEQMYDESDLWLRFVAQNQGLMKIAETELINGVINDENLEKSQNLLREQSRILAKCGLKGMVNLLEPQILPESFYEKRPELRGARCDQPCVALNPYYSPCLDHPEVLAHYREATRKLLEIAPEIGALSIYTNDSGAGVCWAKGLYPGPNGPDACRNVPMGDRMRKWFEAMLAGARDAGGELEILFRPLHYSRVDIHDTIEKAPANAHILQNPGLYVNDPFIARDNAGYLSLAHASTGGAIAIDPSMCYPLVPMASAKLIYFAFETVREAAASDADILVVGGLSPAVDGKIPPMTDAIIRALNELPQNGYEVERIVAEIAGDHVGTELAPFLVSAWQDVDRAFHAWPTKADTNHKTFPYYSVMADRWLTRPLVPDISLLTEDEKSYYMKGRCVQLHTPEELRESFFVFEGTKNYRLPEFKWLVAAYEDVMLYSDRAVATLGKGLLKAETAGEAQRNCYWSEHRHISITRAIWRNMRNVFRAGSIIEFFTGEEKDSYWNMITKDESYFLPAAYKAFFLEAVDDEMENCREIIRLMEESPEKLILTGPKDEPFCFGPDLAAQLAEKISVMERHRADIDTLFPNVGEDEGLPPTYDWADKCKDKDKAIRDKDRAKMGK